MNPTKYSLNDSKHSLEWLIEASNDLGCNTNQLFSALGMNHSLDNLPPLTLSFTKYIEMLEMVANQIQSQAPGLTMADIIDPRSFGIIYYFSVNSSSIKGAAENLEKYHCLLNDETNINFFIYDKYCKIIYRLPNYNLYGSRYDTEITFGILMKVIRSIVNDNYTPVQCNFRYKEPEDLTAYKKYFGDNIRFSQMENSIVFTSEILTECVLDSDEYLLRLLEGEFESKLGKKIVPVCIVKETEMAIQKIIKVKNCCSLSVVAKAIGLSSRQLNKKLACHNESYRTIRDRVVVTMAKEYLLKTNYNILKISELLGYSSSSVFVRFFTMRVGLSPLKYRLYSKRV